MVESWKNVWNSIQHVYKNCVKFVFYTEVTVHVWKKKSYTWL